MTSYHIFAFGIGGIGTLLMGTNADMSRIVSEFTSPLKKDRLTANWF